MTAARVGAAVAAGGFAGAACRYAVGLAVAGPAGTLVANVAGCLLLSVVVSLPDGTLSTRSRALVATGYLSSFTTYSTFVLESVAGGPAPFAAVVVGNYGLGLAAVLAGQGVVRAVDRRGSDPDGENEGRGDGRDDGDRDGGRR